MARKSTAARRTTTPAATRAPGYWEVLDPVAELVFGDELPSGDFRHEVTVYDDRDDRGQFAPGIKVQFRTNGKHRKVTTFSLADLDEFGTLIEELTEVKDGLA